MTRNRAIIVGLAVLGLVLVAIFAARLVRGGPEEDRLSDEQATASAERPSDPESRCGEQRTYDRIKQELFRQAAETRASDRSAYDRLAAYAVLRVEAPVLKRNDEATGTLVCSARVSLDLPPGVAVVGGRTTLTSDLDYAIQAAADGTGAVVTLSGAEGITVPLATLARTGTNPALAEEQEPENAGQPGLVPIPAIPPTGAPEEPTPPATTVPQRAAGPGPSFNCALARTRGEIAVCGDAGLAELDRFMSSKYLSAMRNADSTEKALLQRTRESFLGYRDSCRSNGCIAAAYRGRMREIDDIVRGRWVPPR
jgi:hypothetical protein